MSFSTLSVIALGTAQGQAPAPAAGGVGRPSVAPPRARRRSIAKPVATTDLPAQVFAGGAAANSQANAATPADAKKQERLQKIRQLTFDRRPSAILKAWSTPREEAIKNGPNPAAPAGMAMAAAMPRAARRVVNGGGGDHAAARDDRGPERCGRRRAGGRRQQRARPVRPRAARLPVRRHARRLAGVKAFLKKLPEDEGKAAYEQLIQGLGSPPVDARQHADAADANAADADADADEYGDVVWRGANAPPNPQQFMMEKNAFTNQDVIELARAAPHGLDDERASGLGRILRLALDSGNVVEDFLTRLRAALKLPKGEAPLTERQAAKLLIAADCSIEAGDFLPAPEKAEADNDREALNLLARHYLAVHARDKKTVHLEQAWQVTQAALAAGKVDPAQKDEAMRRAVELTPKIRDALGRAWLEESFTQPAGAGHGDHRRDRIGFRPGPADARLRRRLPAEVARASEAGRRGLARAKRPSSPRSGRAASPCWPRPGSREAEFSYHYDNSTSLGPRM